MNTTHTNDNQKILETNLTTGILLVNLGTPDKPTPYRVAKFLRQFLWDKRVIRVPRIFWWLPLYLFILPFRSFRAAKAYKMIWTKQGSPLKVFTENLAKQLNNYFREESKKSICVNYAMTYGKPNLAQQFIFLEKTKYSHLIIVPLFPQYSSTTTAAVFDSLTHTLRRCQSIPRISFIDHYGMERTYLEALASRIRDFWNETGRRQHLIFSFHGIPESYERAGDPYPKYCFEMSKAIAEILNIPENNWTIAFQSRLGRTAWSKPYLNTVLPQLLAKGIKSIDIIAPSFAVDCLETLEELEIKTRSDFLKAGGKSFRYIPAMNDSRGHVIALAQIIKRYI